MEKKTASLVQLLMLIILTLNLLLENIPGILYCGFCLIYLTLTDKN